MHDSSSNMSLDFVTAIGTTSVRPRHKCIADTRETKIVLTHR